MTSTDPAEDLVPCMRSVQLSDGDKQLMSAFKNKVDDSGQYEAERRVLYRGAHIPSRLFRELDNTVSGGAPPSNSSRIGGPGQNRTVVVTMPTGGASGPAVPASQQEAPEPKKYTGGNIPSRSFRVLQQMTADDQGSAPVLPRPTDGQPRRSPSHYAHGPESVTAARAGAGAAHGSPPPSPTVPSSVPTCERIEQERLQQRRQRQHTTNGRYSGGKIPSRAFQQLSGDFPAGETPDGERPEQKEAVLGELRAVGSGHAPRPARPSAVPSRSFRFLQQEYGCEEPEPEPIRSGPQESDVIHGTPEQQKQRMAATSKTYRLLQADPTAVPSVLGRNRR